MATPDRRPEPDTQVAADSSIPLRIAPDAPPELYRAVAEALAWAYRLTGCEPPA
jgi:type III secretion system FlhB-like substrate exporter